MKMVKLSKLEKNGLQIRCRLDEAAIKEYMEAVENGATLPPVTVFSEDGEKFFLADGFHRAEVARRLGQKSVRCEVREGGFEAALTFALSANSAHGIRRSNEDKRNAVKVAWENRKMLFGVDNPSDGMVAQMCGVTREFASSQVATIATCAPSTVVGKDGKTYTKPPVPVRRPEPPPPPVRDKEDEDAGEDEEEFEEARAMIPVPPPPPPPPPPQRPLPPVPQRPQFERDADGTRIPPEILDTWNRREEMKALLDMQREVRRRVKAAVEAHDPLFAKFARAWWPEVEAAANTICQHLAWAMPELGCPVCQGITADGCKYCGGSGLVSRKFTEVAPIG